MKELVWLVRHTARLVAITTLVVVWFGSGAAAGAEQPSITVNSHGVVKVNTLPPCDWSAGNGVPSSLPCYDFDRLDAGWFDVHQVFHRVWTKPIAKPWHWATRSERHRFHVDRTVQVRVRHLDGHRYVVLHNRHDDYRWVRRG